MPRVSRLQHHSAFQLGNLCRSGQSGVAFMIFLRGAFSAVQLQVRYPDFFGHSSLVNFTNWRTYDTLKNLYTGASGGSGKTGHDIRPDAGRHRVAPHHSQGHAGQLGECGKARHVAQGGPWQPLRAGAGSRGKQAAQRARRGPHGARYRKKGGSVLCAGFAVRYDSCQASCRVSSC